ncbi:hypothetical protein ACLMJK_003599 [Lecanora helva]
MSPFKRAKKKRFGSTGGWLLSTKEYKEWFGATGSSVFWLSGIMGSGKTILTACVIDELLIRQAGHAKIIFFLIDYNNANSLKARTILKSLLSQCLTIDRVHEHESVLESLSSLDGDIAEFEELFVTVFSRISANTWVVIDGMDELAQPERRVMLSALSRIALNQDISTKLFVSSRDDLGVGLRNQFPSLFHMTTLCEESAQDIARYVELGVDEKIQQGELCVGDENIVGLIKEKLIEGARGIQTSDDGILETLQTLPSDLTETYRMLLTRISRSGKGKTVQRMFLFTTTVKRPLSLSELRDAIAVRPDQEYFEPGHLVNDTSHMVSWTHSLLLLDEEDDLITFAHYMIKDFLSLLSQHTDKDLDGFIYDYRTAEITVGHICCTYLRFKNFDTRIMPAGGKHPQHFAPRDISTRAIFQDNDPILAKPMLALERWKHRKGRLGSNYDSANLGRFVQRDAASSEINSVQHFIFLNYARSYWLDHAAETTPDESNAWDAFKKVFYTDSNNALVIRPFPFHELDSLTPSVSRYIVEHDHIGLILLLNMNYSSTIARTMEWYSRYLSLLPAIMDSASWDAIYFFTNRPIIKDALQFDIDRYLFECYHQALKSGKTLIAIWILRFCLKILDPDTLHFEACRDYSNELNPRTRSRLIWSKFVPAAQEAIHHLRGYESAIDLETWGRHRGYEADNYERAIRLAVSEYPISKHILQLLILCETRRFGANYFSAPSLRTAVQRGDHQFCEALVEVGICPQSRSVLQHIAIKNDDVTTLRLLLAKGASLPTSPPSKYEEILVYEWSPLCAAVAKGSPQMVSMLLQAGADPNAVVFRLLETPGRRKHPPGRRGDLTTPLLEAVSRPTSKAFEEILKLLVEAGAYTKLQDLPRNRESLAQYSEYSEFIPGFEEDTV